MLGSYATFCKDWTQSLAPVKVAATAAATATAVQTPPTLSVQPNQTDGSTIPNASTQTTSTQIILPDAAQHHRLSSIAEILQLNKAGKLHDAPLAFTQIMRFLDNDPLIHDFHRRDVLALAWTCLQTLLDRQEHPWASSSSTLPLNYRCNSTAHNAGKKRKSIAN